jgi:hypothetical protein
LIREAGHFCAFPEAKDSGAGLPDGFFSNQKSQFLQILEGLRWENVDIFYCHLEYFTEIREIL